ncbi:acyltransferase family protein [Porphyromonas sp.]
MGKQRLLSLDALKGVAILMVLLGHIGTFSDPDGVPTQTLLHTFIYVVHMPLFILVAGYFAQRKVDSWSALGKFFRDKFTRLIVPAFLWYTLYSLWTKGGVNYAGLLGNHYWFTFTLFNLLTLFMGQCVAIGLLLRCLKKEDNRMLEVLLQLLAMIGVYYALSALVFPSILPAVRTWMTLKGLVACFYPFLTIGWIVGRLELLEKLRTKGVTVIAFLLFAGSLVCLNQEPEWKSYLEYGGLWHVNRLLALSFFVLMANVMSAVTERGGGLGLLSRGLVKLGQWSLPIYFVHYFFLPALPGMNAFLAGITPTLRLSTELFVLLGGTVMTLLPTLAVIYCIRLNPYLDFALFGEKGRLKK